MQLARAMPQTPRSNLHHRPEARAESLGKARHFISAGRHAHRAGQSVRLEALVRPAGTHNSPHDARKISHILYSPFLKY